jgi:hypothetical protein
MEKRIKERPILFSAPMIRAILEGRKTQTRRIVKPREADYPRWQPVAVAGYGGWVDAHGKRWPCPCGQPGDGLWVRETWAAPHAYDHLPPRLIPQDASIHYAATRDLGGLLWRPSIHMPRWASRITLEVVEVRVQRLQDISPNDRIAEGAWPIEKRESGRSREAVAEFKALWNSTYGRGRWDSDPFDANPYVWAISFRRVDPAGEPIVAK